MEHQKGLSTLWKSSLLVLWKIYSTILQLSLQISGDFHKSFRNLPNFFRENARGARAIFHLWQDEENYQTSTGTTWAKWLHYIKHYNKCYMKVLQNDMKKHKDGDLSMFEDIRTLQDLWEASLIGTELSPPTHPPPFPNTLITLLTHKTWATKSILYLMYKNTDTANISRVHENNITVSIVIVWEKPV